MISSAFLDGLWKMAGIKVSAAWYSLIMVYWGMLSSYLQRVVETGSRVLRAVCSTAQLSL